MVAWEHWKELMSLGPHYSVYNQLALTERSQSINSHLFISSIPTESQGRYGVWQWRGSVSLWSTPSPSLTPCPARKTMATSLLVVSFDIQSIPSMISSLVGAGRQERSQKREHRWSKHHNRQTEGLPSNSKQTDSTAGEIRNILLRSI